jgi:hypothetical protein
LAALRYAMKYHIGDRHEKARCAQLLSLGCPAAAASRARLERPVLSGANACPGRRASSPPPGAASQMQHAPPEPLAYANTLGSFGCQWRKTALFSPHCNVATGSPRVDFWRDHTRIYPSVAQVATCAQFALIFTSLISPYMTQHVMWLQTRQ